MVSAFVSFLWFQHKVVSFKMTFHVQRIVFAIFLAESKIQGPLKMFSMGFLLFFSVLV